MAEMLIAIGKDTEKIMDSLNLLCSICRDSPVELLRQKGLQGLAWPTDSWYYVGLMTYLLCLCDVWFIPLLGR